MNKITYRSVITSAFIVAFGVVPPTIGATLGATSAAAGLLVGVVTLLLITKSIPAFDVFLNKIVLCLAFFFALYMPIQSILVGSVGIKSLLSILLIIFLLASAKALGKTLNRYYTTPVIAVCCFVFLIIFIVNLYYDFRIGTQYNYGNRTVFPFGEPSHFALYTGPFFIAFGLLFRTAIVRIAILALMLFITVQMQSVTFLIYASILGSLIIVTNLFSVMNLFVLFPITYLAFNYVFSPENSYFIDRLIFSTNTDNLSLLVYLQGLEDAKNSFTITAGLGLGFQMLGTQPPSDISYVIAQILGPNFDTSLNRLDGGFLAAKIIAEFGFFGILLLFAYVFSLLKSFIFLFKALRDTNHHMNLFVLKQIFILASLVEVFVRGIGYFSPSLFILLVLIFAQTKPNPKASAYL